MMKTGKTFHDELKKDHRAVRVGTIRVSGWDQEARFYDSEVLDPIRLREWY